MDNEKAGHVHFSEDTDEIGHTMINIKKNNEENYEAHVGFLQIYHKYKLVMDIPLKNAAGGFEMSSTKVQSAYTKLTSIMEEKEKLEIICEFVAYKEKLLKEKIFLTGPDNKELIVTIFARVLGKGKGTPMLREGVTCLGVEHTEDESEASDWQGFD